MTIDERVIQTNAKRISTMFHLALMGIALWVFVGKAQDRAMWLEIALYWAVLALKYFAELLMNWKHMGVSAEWILCEDGTEQSWYCSNCDEIVFERTNNCPHCGARMTGKHTKGETGC